MTCLFNHLATKNHQIKTINIFSDGASSQFKQRYLFSNLHEWETDFGVQLVWNFLAMSNGKGAVDGIGGTLKRSVCRVVRAGTKSPIDAASYTGIATQRNPNINVVYISSEEIKLQSDKKSALWDTALAIPNTQKLHCIRTNNVAQLEVSIISSDESFSLVNIFKVPEDTESESGESQLNLISDSPNSDIQIDIGDWVHYQGSNFPGEVTAIYGLAFQVNVMHKSGNILEMTVERGQHFISNAECYKKIGTTRSRRNAWTIYF